MCHVQILTCLLISIIVGIIICCIYAGCNKNKRNRREGYQYPIPSPFSGPIFADSGIFDTNFDTYDEMLKYNETHKA